LVADRFVGGEAKEMLGGTIPGRDGLIRIARHNRYRGAGEVASWRKGPIESIGFGGWSKAARLRSVWVGLCDGPDYAVVCID
jgi:hypothetical protein